MPINSETCHPLLPGLEVYKTIDYAVKNQKNIEYAERALDKSALNAIKVEKRLGLLHMFYRYYFGKNKV